MENDTAAFELIYNLSIITVQQLPGNNGLVYKITFSNEVPGIVISTSASEETGDWDTVPPGNTELAAGIGRLIEQHNAGGNLQL